MADTARKGIFRNEFTARNEFSYKKNNKYYQAGQALAMAVVHGGLVPGFMSDPMFAMLLEEDYRAQDFQITGVLGEKVKQLKEAFPDVRQTKQLIEEIEGCGGWLGNPAVESDADLEEVVEGNFHFLKFKQDKFINKQHVTRKRPDSQEKSLA